MFLIFQIYIRKGTIVPNFKSIALVVRKITEGGGVVFTPPRRETNVHKKVVNLKLGLRIFILK